ncbi:sulfatase family protein [Caulifigura coniformis]|uniref:sulfatase family protein n=1 Tax=Caulifigura coniformis TaxID=2527983 RepID=UPI0018D25B54|nr:sulfatase [Caulifigura coniformis]
MRNILWLVVVASFAFGGDPLQAVEATKPNILFVLSDDHTAAHLGCSGDTTVKTPNLDRFAGEGIRFTKMFTVAPQCVPSRAGYMTGRSAVSVRMTRFNSPLPRDVVTLPELLRKDGGYYTGVCRRSFHLDGPGGNRLGPVTRKVYQDNDLASFDERVDFLDRNSPRAQTKSKVTEFLGQVPAGKPWFLWVNFNDPHHPWDRDAVNPPYDPASIKLPPHLPDLPGVREDLARYLAEIGRADEEFQIVLDAVKAKAGLDNTLIIFAGDNGHAFPHGKGSLYDPGLNVPLLIRWAGQIKPGQVSDVLVSGEDIAPTCLEAAGLKPDPKMTGKSLLPLLKGEASSPREFIFAERGVHGSSNFTEKTRSSGYDLARCARSGRYKYIYNCTPWMTYSPVDSAGDPGWKQMVAAHEAGQLPPAIDKTYFTSPRPIFEFYDLEADPGELNNLAGKPEVAAEEKKLRSALIEKMILDWDYLPLPAE